MEMEFMAESFMPMTIRFPIDQPIDQPFDQQELINQTDDQLDN
jgi:hypothetical protein